MIKHILFALCCLVIIYLTAYLIDSPVSSISSFQNDTGYTISDDFSTNGFVYNLLPESSPCVQDFSTPNLTTEETPTVISTISGDYEEIFSGVFYKSNDNIVIIRAELNNPNVRFFVSPSSSPATVCNQLNRYNLQIAVNGGGFDIGGTGQAINFAMSDRETYSTETQPGITIAITEDNQVIFSQMNEKIPSDTIYAVSGFNRLVYRGQILSRFYPGDSDYKAGYGTVRPRTTISTDGKYLTIVLFESPTTIADAAEYILDLFPDTSDVFNMDGGGSTNGCAEGIGPLITETGRPVANIFGIYAQP